MTITNLLLTVQRSRNGMSVPFLFRHELFTIAQFVIKKARVQTARLVVHNTALLHQNHLTSPPAVSSRSGLVKSLNMRRRTIYPVDRIEMRHARSAAGGQEPGLSSDLTP